MSEQKQQCLPDSWTLASLGELGTWMGGGTPSKSEPRYWDGGTIPWISPKDMKVSRISETEDHITQVAVAESNVKPLASGSVVVVARSGILQRTLPLAVTAVETTMNQDLKGMTPHNGVDSLYVCYALRRHEQEILQTCSKNGTTVASIEFPRLLAFPLPIPPLAEQRRIVAAIEEQFSRLDAAVASLERARANLKRYRAAVLQAAVTGGLKPPQDHDSPNVFSSTEAVQDEPAALPIGWCRVQLGDLLREPLRNGHSARASMDGTGVRTLTLTAVTKRDFSEKNTKLTTADPVRVRDLWLQDCDIFIERSNTPELVGTACIYRGEPNYAIFPDLLIRARFDGSRASSEFIDLALQSEVMRRFFQHRAQGISGSMPKIDQRTIEEAPISLPSLTEQQSIVAEVGRQMSIIDSLDFNLECSLKRAERLRQAILKRAFAGELVPQDPSDEPASVLLERIRAERAPTRHGQVKKTRNKSFKQAVML